MTRADEHFAHDCKIYGCDKDEQEQQESLKHLEDGSYSHVNLGGCRDFPDVVDEERYRWLEHPIHDIHIGTWKRTHFGINTRIKHECEDILFHICFAYPPAVIREEHFLSLKNMIKLRDLLTRMIDRYSPERPKQLLEQT